MKQLFKEEIEKIETVDIKVFAQNALQAAPDSFKKDEDLITYTRKVFRVIEALLDSDQVTGNVRDIILVATLLCDLGQNEDEKYKDIHPLLVRPLLNDVKNDLVPQLWEGILRIVEAHEGKDTPISSIEPKPGSAEHLVALAHVITRSESITISL